MDGAEGAKEQECVNADKQDGRTDQGKVVLDIHDEGLDQCPTCKEMDFIAVRHDTVTKLLSECLIKVVFPAIVRLFFDVWVPVQLDCPKGSKSLRLLDVVWAKGRLRERSRRLDTTKHRWQEHVVKRAEGVRVALSCLDRPQKSCIGWHSFRVAKVGFIISIIIICEVRVLAVDEVQHRETVARLNFLSLTQHKARVPRLRADALPIECVAPLGPHKLVGFVCSRIIVFLDSVQKFLKFTQMFECLARDDIVVVLNDHTYCTEFLLYWEQLSCLILSFQRWVTLKNVTK